uniref:Integrase catalytic domain-containing protein n=1 Tax=Fagus sylvatica TaxID=28930 RepID=A0A2N9HPA0_FAGSY
MILLSNISNLVSVKLDHSNYVLWKYQITSILKAYSVLSFVDGTQQCPPEYLQNSNGSLQENSLYQQWISRDQGLLTLINSTLSPTALSLVVGQTTAHGVWSILEKRYTSSSRSNILNLKMELHNIKKESTDSINSFLQKIKDTRDRLGAVGVQIDNEEILHIVLKGLPHEYHAFGTAIRTRNDATSFEDIHVLLTAEEQSLQSTIELSKEHAHMAMLANANRTLFSSQGNRGRGRNSFNRGRGRNFHNNSGRGGYNNAGNNSSGNAGSPGGFNNHYNSSPTQSYNQRPACQICGKNGHAALDCYHRMDYSYQGKQPPSKLAAMAATSNSQHSDQSYWISDTGATDHFTPDLSTIPDHQEYTGTDLATVGNGQAIPITHIGNSQLKASSHLFHLRKVLRVPSMASNLLSVNKFCRDNNCCFLFDANQFKIKDMPTGKLLYRGPSKNSLYPIDGVSLPPPCHTSNFSSIQSVSSKVWHDRLGHPNSQVQQRIFSNSPVHNSSSNKTESACTHCIQGKMTHLPFHKSVSKACKPLEIIHSDVWGPSPITSDGDCGGEYASNEFHSFCISHGITHQYTCPHTSQQNGLAERKHRHIVDIALTLISQSSLPLSFWPYAFSTAVYLINRVPPSNSKTSSPWELLFHRQPNYASLRTFGCLCYPLMRPYNSHKLQPRSVECVFLRTRAKSGIFKPKQFHHTLVNDYLNTEPPTYKIASQLPQWQDAMTSEFQALQRQNTWTLVPSSSNQNLVGCRWVYKLKRNSDGSIARYKARLVAKGYHQQQGMDYDETFSPVVKPATVRLILSIAAQQNWSLKKHCMGSNKHPVLGLRDLHHTFSLWGSLHPSLIHPYFSIDKVLLLCILLLYVDDIIVTGNQPTAIQSLITKLAQEFDIKDLGQLKFFLGLQIDYRSSGFFVHQHKYATDLLAKFNMSTCKPCSTPFVSLSRIRKDDGIPLSDPTPFRSMVGGLQYLTFTRPDLSYAVNHICQFMHQPTDHHLVAAKRILRYVQGTLHHGLTFRPGPLSLTAFTDSDWAGDPMDRRSTIGLIVFLGHNPITWQSKKQPTVARSSTEAEYRALANCAADLAWVRMVLKDLGIFLHAPPTIWCDNLSALALATNPVFHARTKHVEVDYHFIREKVTNRDLQLHHISTDDQLADILTKALPSPRFRYLQDKLMPHSTSHQFEGG